MFSMPLGSRLTQKNVNPRLLIAVGALVAFSCFYIASAMENFYAFAALYVVAFAVNHGMVYMVPIHHGWLWFPDHPGLVSGVILGGFGLGSLIFNLVLTHLVNPWNDKSDAEGYYPDRVNERFMLMWRTLVTCWLVIVIIAFIMIFPGPVPAAVTSEAR